jgi:hypothetical protein
MIWSWLLIGRVSRLVDDLRDPASADAAWAELEGAPLMVAEAVGQAMAGWDYWLPLTDRELAGVLARDGVPVPVGSAPAGAVVQLQDGRLGLVAAAGVIESHGVGLSIVPPTPGRYRAAWLVPGVAYLGGS